jgi:hypothetical protein
MHMYFDTSNLNAPYDGLPGLGAGSLGGSSLGSLGAPGALGEYPWKEKANETTTLQGLINQVLEQWDYCPIAVDGKLGGATCGAASLVRDSLGVSVPVPNACLAHQSEWVTPRHPPCAAATPTPTPTTTQPVVRAQVGGNGWGWLVGGALVAAAAVGFAIWKKQH